MDSEFPLVLVREAHDSAPQTLRDRNDEILEHIYIGRRFTCYLQWGDTVRVAFPEGKRLEKMFEMYTKMTSQQSSPKKATKRK